MLIFLAQKPNLVTFEGVIIDDINISLIGTCRNLNACILTSALAEDQYFETISLKYDVAGSKSIYYTLQIQECSVRNEPGSILSSQNSLEK